MRSKRSSELPPLSTDEVAGRKHQRLTQLPTASIGPRSSPKVYPRLQTLSQLTSTVGDPVFVEKIRSSDTARETKSRDLETTA
ncbi:hypothetical protein L914_02035 [Phytophthora nicotianae]|uniref:Uncharacterized protein n=1 Tax=Phytophthora nicotianae TaxID=4792 RepID=W2P1G2_PHYNI|nr:hypothetical protein L914_02035 [Phytophthora nicotianae]